MGIVTSGTISFYVILLYMPTFARVQLHLPLDQAFIAQAISLTCMIVITPLPVYCLTSLVASRS
jgi:MHS family proline/betaine transporter-like MFS transporter